jgi:purine-cytosine permease-like protein
VLALALLLLVSTLLSLFGYMLVQRVAQIARVPLTLLFAALAIWVAPQMQPLSLGAGALHGSGLSLLAAIITFGAACFAHAAGWAPYAADYSRSLPTTTAPRRVFWQTLLGASQASYVGLLAHLVSDADLGYPVALLVSVPLYLLLQTRQQPREAGYQKSEEAKA